ncbi:DUF2937 family protein [Salibaculum griseiflavum]|uniref:DUF2937 domain-containing protein n=1 Tax=Salibaculum griseiflavum TaxID=1914409 RepID=A0A2V1P0T7_9RHOB|nr:DUF2937 family protein [Salibaculum griseiflavum]PWG15986.1 DUF2937 domain-containing protein [Salibaculum griseiflavum]
MIVRAAALAGGLAGAAGLSQYPEFTQQYTQHLAGQIEALSVVAADFDASAARSDLTRDEALAQMTGTDFLQDRRADMTRAFARLYQLTSHHDALQAAGPLERLTMPHRMGDAATLRGTWAGFKPAVPLTLAGALSALVGFLVGVLALRGVFALVSWPVRRLFAGRAAKPSAARVEPPVALR